MFILAILLITAVGPAAAQCSSESDCESQLRDQMSTVGNFLSVIIAAVAIPNGAFGIFQWMTAGTDTEQSSKGRKRIRNSFIGVAGAGVILIAVEMLSVMLGVGGS
jgi:hypothetical protein